MIAVDSNILVYAHREDSQWHDAAYACMALNWLKGLRRGLSPGHAFMNFSPL